MAPHDDQQPFIEIDDVPCEEEDQVANDGCCAGGEGSSDVGKQGGAKLRDQLNRRQRRSEYDQRDHATLCARQPAKRALPTRCAQQTCEGNRQR